MRAFLREHLENWQDDLPVVWREAFDGARVDFNVVPEDIDDPERIFPLPRSAGGTADRHLLRAFDRIAPAGVRVILIGQDPYPEEIRATGQAFEDGAVAQIADTTSPSLRRIVQSAAAECLQRAELAQRDTGWATMRTHFALPATAGVFNGLNAQGVICLNAAWTFTGISRRELNGHLRLWRPVVRSVVRFLLQRDPGCVVLAIGSEARDLFNTRLPRPVRFVDHVHPQERANRWFAEPNPLAEVNRHLVAMGRASIYWLPGLACRYPIDR